MVFAASWATLRLSCNEPPSFAVIFAARKATVIIDLFELDAAMAAALPAALEADLLEKPFEKAVSSASLAVDCILLLVACLACLAAVQLAAAFVAAATFLHFRGFVFGLAMCCTALTTFLTSFDLPFKLFVAFEASADILAGLSPAFKAAFAAAIPPAWIAKAFEPPVAMTVLWASLLFFSILFKSL